jgi:hypothetical protein
MMLSLVGDGIVAILLVATIGYAATLNRRLSMLRGDRAKIDEMIQALSAAAQRAEAGISGLKDGAVEMGQELERTIANAKRLKDDLAYMVERGGGMADRLEGNIRARRDEPPAPERKREAKNDAPARSEPKLATPPADQRAMGPSRAERELLRALAGR